MRDTLFYKASKYCWEHNIYVVVVPLASPGKFKLALSTNGKEKLGQEIYEVKSSRRLVSVVLPSGKLENQSVEVVPLHVGIQNLYISIYNKNTKENENKIQILETAS